MNLKGKRGMSGFLAMEALNLNCGVERAHGRMAMVGFAGRRFSSSFCGEACSVGSGDGKESERVVCSV